MFVQDISHNGCGTSISHNGCGTRHITQWLWYKHKTMVFNCQKPCLNFCTFRVKFQNDAVLVNVLLCLYKTYHTMVVVQDISHNGCGTRHITQWLWYKTYHTMVVVQDISHNGCGTNISPGLQLSKAMLELLHF